MINNFKYAAAFLIGAAVGAAIAFKYASKKLEESENSEPADDVQELYSEALEDIRDHSEEKVEIPEEVLRAADEAKHKKDISEYASIVQDEEYSKVEKPYTITPEEFGEYGYETISLTYYADGVLADENGEVVDDIDEIVGEDSLSHFGEYEDDSVYVRNDAKRCDYEILRELSDYNGDEE